MLLCLTVFFWGGALEIPPFVLYPLPKEEAHLCPVRAVADWIEESKLTNGFLFRRIASGDRIAEANVPMVSLLSVVPYHSCPTPFRQHSSSSSSLETTCWM